MAEFKIGDAVRNVHTNIQGFVIKVYEPQRGRQMYEVFYSQDNQKPENENDIERFLEIKDLFDRCLQGDFRGYSDFQVYNTTFKIDNSSNNTLSSIKASKTLFKTYQYLPLMKLLNSEMHRLLIADEVGLGKTIEAGHIMLELKARQELKNVLVVCPTSLKSKWQEELYERFGLNFEIYENADRLRDDIRAHSGNARGIITYDSIRGNKMAKVFKFLGESSKNLSLLVCDEAHRLKNKSTKQHKAVATLLQFADAALFLTATPIMLGRDNLFQLLHLLNSERYENELAFEDETRHNEPFVWAVNALSSNVPLKEIKKGLEERIPADDYVRELPLFAPLMEKLDDKETPKQKALIQNDLYDINPLSSIMTRTRKVDVTTDLSQAVRETRTISIELSEIEKELFNRYMDELKNAKPLARSTPSQQIASSVYAYKGIIPNFENVPDAKFDKLIEIINLCKTKGSGKVIVFVGYKNTQRYLAERLNYLKIPYRFINGDDREGRTTAVEEFRTIKDVQVLLSTEVGSEGLDMQFCDTLVNYDLPWNPMVVEQRIGRIDRIGQQSKKIHIYSFVLKGSIQEKIQTRLLDRIEDFRKTIGDLEPILSQELDDESTIGKKIQELYSTDLTDKERDEKMKKIEQAIQRNLLDSTRLEKELSDTFSNDSYLRTHLNAIIRNKAYVTELELKNYVQNLFKKELPTCTISQGENGVYNISVPQSDKKVIINLFNRYITKFQGEDKDLINEYIGKIREKTILKITFSQEIAEQNRNITYLNIYHPFALVAKECFRKSVETNTCVFRYKLLEKEIETDNEVVLPGYYMLAIYDIETEHNRYGRKRKTHEMMPVLYDIQSQDLVKDEIITEAIYRAIQTSGKHWDAKDVLDMDKNLVGDMRTVFNGEVSAYCKERREYITLKQKNDIEQQRKNIETIYSKRINDEQSYIQYLEQRLSFCEKQITEGRGNMILYDMEMSSDEFKRRFEPVLPARRGLLQSYKDEYERRIIELAEIPNPVVDNKLMMLNLISVS